MDDDGGVDVHHQATTARTRRVAHAAILGFGLTTEVAAGENTGRTLKHDFVALDHQTAPMSNGTAALSLTTDHPDAKRLALAVWVSGPDSPAPQQAAGGWVDN